MFHSIFSYLWWIFPTRSENLYASLLKNSIDENDFKAGILESLSLDIVIEIISFLDRFEFIRLFSGVNKSFYSLTEDKRFWLILDRHDEKIPTVTQPNSNFQPILCFSRIEEYLKSSEKTSFKTIYKNLLLSPTPHELNPVFKNRSAIYNVDTDLIPETKKYIALFGQSNSGKYSLGICSTRGYSRPSDQKSVIKMDFFFKRVLIKMENLSSHHNGNISGICHTNFVIECFGHPDFHLKFRNNGMVSMNSLSLGSSLSIMFTIDLSVKNNYFLSDLSKILNPLFQVDISKDSPQKIRKKMGNNRLCIIGTKSDIRQLSEQSLASQLMKVIDTSCEFWDQSIIYIETSSKNRENMDHPYLFFSQSNIHSQIQPNSSL
ncbi:Hypothetical protein NAEGRDRAFT_67209 [Naegleria gruberi]|uniref:F-box domain-containing protein n=1 Tax=Naegleria gruberi TaxID=5762 RepID=D2VEA6_NAEGR|nr:uncharacterized protein NAEGRDRAFT_67209 [Naegleria gruberi]EFC44764.1 Hypothetical protein NAEGRDRAFT_67209 [Naegleria gruberi]|eukprot:XP_002677508.1 Hypothetical protein NAEGRDRAFT_67209 [Naegleria gruberi strain NEG-M]